MAGRISALAALLLIQVTLSCWGQVMLDEDIDDTSDMDGGYGIERRFNGDDLNGGRRNGPYPDDRGRNELFNKSPYDDDDLDHRGHEHSVVYQNSHVPLAAHNLLFSLPILILIYAL